MALAGTVARKRQFKEINVDIFEQLENKVAKTIQTLEIIQLEKMELQEELEQAQQTIADQQSKLDELEQKSELLSKETTRLAHEKNEVETRIASLMQTLELAVSDAEQVLGLGTTTSTEEVDDTAGDTDAGIENPVDTLDSEDTEHPAEESLEREVSDAEESGSEQQDADFPSEESTEQPFQI